MKTSIASRLLGVLLPYAIAAQAAPASAPISQVLVYPGGATVQRTANVAAGARELVIHCLPARFEADSLQVQADAGIQIGEISIQTLDRVRVPECHSSPLDTRIRELEDQRASINAESEAQDLALGFLKSYGGAGDGKSAPAPITSTLEALKRGGQETWLRKHQLARRLQDLDEKLSPLQAERDRLIQANPQLRSVRINLAAARAGELRLSYRLNQAGWIPIYRAHLDTQGQQLRLERLAQVAQTSGEDWSGVQLRLSTSTPRSQSGLPPPYPWTLDILPPIAAQELQLTGSRMAAPLMAAPAPAFKSNRSADEAPALPSFDISTQQGEYAAEFEVPGRVSISSDGQRVSFALGSEKMTAQVFARVQPQQDRQAYLLAELNHPSGSWPAGALQLFRDGAFIGNSQLQLGSEEKLELFFGRDELLRVAVEPPQKDGAERGFIGSRNEQKIRRAYLVENLHRQPIQLQLIEPSPVAQHEDIKVQTQFNPQPSQQRWKQLPGVVAWQLQLAPGQSQRFTAEYLISTPKDARVSGLR
ncbi:hypothetical protein C1O66_13430 [Paucibacter aquatile]|uniref:Mucoidy inhibitor MuiA family protein n=1 Tax=Kinneretia aquatilis TaxID=2070761 RepID=A0A2N8KY90_9BURK|nr:DUF4139 domain-containing protein [Paucibacter aquatile]PND38426.1 hypothetical protein C1O66_13430 [Paucibacter aquatile]